MPLARLRRGAAAVACAATIVVAVAGCEAASSRGGHRSADPALDANRANWLRGSIARNMSHAALTELQVITIVTLEGGGYVKQITVSGPRGMPGQQTTIDTVLGTSPVPAGPPSATVNSPDGQNPVECFTFMIGWLDTTAAPPVRKDCQETALGTAPTLAIREATWVAAATVLAAVLIPAVLALPAAPVPAIRQDVLGRLAKVRAFTVKELSPSMGRDKASQEWNYATANLSFAAGGEAAAAALPVPGGGCAYLAFAPPSAAGSPATVWAAPAMAPCTGAAALSAAGPVTAGPHGGGNASGSSPGLVAGRG